MYDVIVIGAGPTGCTAANTLAAKAIIEHFNNLEMVYDGYKKKVENLKAYMERQWNFAAEIADTFNEMKMNFQELPSGHIICLEKNCKKV